MNLSTVPFPLPVNRTTLLASEDVDGDLLPPDAAAWFQMPAGGPVPVPRAM